MINVNEALNIIKEQAVFLGNEYVDIEKATGRIISTDVLADRDFPPFNRVSMDGIAISYQQWKGGQKSYKVESVVAAGTPIYTIKNEANCVEIMTGAVLPNGLDTVIRYEDLSIQDGTAIINIETVRKNQNVHPKGLDKKKGIRVISRGIRISAAEVGIAATVGKDKLWVKKMPSCLLVSTGDELVEIFEEPKMHQIRRSNVYALKALLSQWGVQANLLHLNDNVDEIRNSLEVAFQDYDAIILSGAVSKGKFDFLPEVLEELGVEKLFHKISQRPGKPFWFGTKINGPTIFAMPGNPVSSFMCAIVYFKSWLWESLGLPEEKIYAKLEKEIQFKPNLTYFAQVTLKHQNNARIIAVPREGKGSGDLANLGENNAFMMLPKGRDQYLKDDYYRCFPFKAF